MSGKFDGALLVSDMDETLLTMQGTISDRNKAAIDYFTENGGYFTVATGRMVDAVRAYMPRLGINVPAILHNGAKLYDYPTESVLYEKTIEEERKEAIRRFHDDYPHVGIEIYANETVYIYRACAHTARFLTRSYKVVYDMPDCVWDMPWIKVLLIGNYKLLDECEKTYRRYYDGGYCVRSGSDFFDIVANGVSKGTGMMRLANKLGVERRNIIAVGDNLNDLSMIKEAGISYAVWNAVDMIKETATYGAPSHQDNAIEYIVNELDQMR